KNTLLFVIAAITMVIDHIGIVFFPEHIFLRMIGRISFPIYAYGIAQGVKHTSNFKKYITRILIAAVIAQPFYMYSLRKGVNIMFELILFATVLNFVKNEKNIHAIILALLTAVLNLDYGLYGLILAFGFFIMDEEKLTGIILISIATFVSALGSIMFAQGFAILALPLILFLPNINIKLPKYFFYAFYPLHLIIISFIKFI
ncbi:MAG: hypothetical protein IKU80_06335, partial [Firmicutes bacterium]|nr:hypothetical protein [Bacillota bacterium]